MSLIVAIFLGILVYKIVFSPFSIAIESHPKRVFVNSSSPVAVRVLALNRIGFRVPFLHLRGQFVISEGAEKIEIVKVKSDELIFKTKSSAGKLVVLYYTKVVPFPVEIDLKIEAAAIACLSRIGFSSC